MVKYRGYVFQWYNTPKKSPLKTKKKMVLAKKPWEDPKLIHFGYKPMKDFTQHKSEKRRKSYLARSAGIKTKDWKLTKNDKYSANYWSRKVLR